MHKIFIVLSLLITGLVACNKEDAGTKGFDLSNTLPPYVTILTADSKKAIAVTEGTSTNVIFQVRTALQEAVTVTYNASGGGLNLTNQTALIDRNKLTGTTKINIPADAIVAPGTTAKCTVTLVKAVTASGRQLTIGQKNVQSEAININITK